MLSRENFGDVMQGLGAKETRFSFLLNINFYSD